MASVKDLPRVIVKFQDTITLPYVDGAEKYLEEFGIKGWQDLLKKFPGVSLQRLLVSKSPAQIGSLVERAQKRDPNYNAPNFLTYFRIDCPLEVDPRKLAAVLSRWKLVDYAYVDPPESEPNFSSIDPHYLLGCQRYLGPADVGIDAEFAWNLPNGGAGEGQDFIDIERGWILPHAEFPDVNLLGNCQIPVLDIDIRSHGTAVLGIVCAKGNNGSGGTGIAPNVKTKMAISSYVGCLTGLGVNAILAACSNLPFGGILLIEIQKNSLPIETWLADFDVIRLATALGIVVIEPAGNGRTDLDTFRPSEGYPLNRGTSRFRDSGAIMVAAATSTIPHAKVSPSNFGSRIDCYAWGENIYDASVPILNLSTASCQDFNQFGGTSGAAAIVAGAALIVQGIAQNNLGYRFDGWQMRNILGDPTTGILPAAMDVGKIGVMPNLRSIIQSNSIGLTPDIYIRDYIGDTGQPHLEPISASPDIIVLPNAVPDPNLAFGEGSGNENIDTLGSEVESGQDNFIYLRVKNRGAVAANSVTGSIYWSEASSLPLPDQWTKVGSVAIPVVPSGNLLTVSNAILWEKSRIPAFPHFCLVGLVGTALDPEPIQADFINVDKFYRFIRDNNNVTWRNVNVVNYIPDQIIGPVAYMRLPFVAAGFPQAMTVMDLEIVAKLPQGSKVLLEVAINDLILLKNTLFATFDDLKQRAYLPMNPNGSFIFKYVGFAPKARMQLSILVSIPDTIEAHAFDVYARQSVEGKELGRVTWVLGPNAKNRKQKQFWDRLKL